MNANVQAISASRDPVLFVIPPTMWLVFLLGCIAMGVGFSSSLNSLANVWFQSEEFGYGPALPFICGFLIWQQRRVIEGSTFSGSWAGVVVLGISITIALVGQVGSIPSLAHLGIIGALASLTLAAMGWPVFRHLLGAFVILLLCVPLPAFFLNTLSLKMQLISSEIGVAIVRLFGISVFLEGNVIDLGVYKLEVAEACNGLRYLFPLMTIGFLMAYLFKVRMWKRVLLFLSSIPITIIMNSVRIGVIGVMVDRWGTAMAEGFLHDFQGWAVFMVSMGLMLLEMILLSRIGSDKRHWREVFGLEFPPPRDTGLERKHQLLQPSLIVATAIAVSVSAVAGITPRIDEIIPARHSLVEFPNQLDEWSGRRTAMEPVYLDALKLDDYLLADYVRNGVAVNFYVAWYNSQSSGQSAHSPRSCLPGGGWRMESLDQIVVNGNTTNSSPLKVNRALISQGQNRQLVYYWFQQRGRVITNEYLVKWYLFWDSLTQHRTDGAMIRLVVPLAPTTDVSEADATLKEFIADATPHLPRFVPN